MPTKFDVYVFKSSSIFINGTAVPRAFRPQMQLQKYMIKQQIWNCAKLMIYKSDTGRVNQNVASHTDRAKQNKVGDKYRAKQKTTCY